MLFGEVNNNMMRLNRWGMVAHQAWLDIPKYYANVNIDEFIIMPNHMHGIIVITSDDDECVDTEYYSVDDKYVGTEYNSVHVKNVGTGYYPVPVRNDRNYGLLSKVIKSYKHAVTKTIRQEFQTSIKIWQRSYYDHIIRKEKDLYAIRYYIKHNPLKWASDRNNINKM